MTKVLIDLDLIGQAAQFCDFVGGNGTPIAKALNEAVAVPPSRNCAQCGLPYCNCGLTTLSGSMVRITALALSKALHSDPMDIAHVRRAVVRLVALLPQSAPSPQWQPIETAPRDSTVLRLLVEFSDNSLEDTSEPVWTIGTNCFDNDGIDAWQFAGWNWTHDCFTEGHGKPIGWLPMGEAPSAPAMKDVAAKETLKALGYTYHGGELWKPPLGHHPATPFRLPELKLLMITTAYEQGVGKGIQRKNTNPYAEGTDEHAAWYMGYREGVDKPSPKAEGEPT